MELNGTNLETIDIFLWSIVIAVFFIIIIYFFVKYRKMETGSGVFILGIVCFATFFTMSRIVDVLRRLMGGKSTVELYNYFLMPTTIEIWDLVLRLFYYVFIWLGIAIFYFAFEKYVMNNRTKFILMITSIFTTFLSFAMYFTGWQDWIFLLYAVCFFIVGLFPVVLFLYLAKTAITRAQRIAWLVMIVGFLLLLLGVLGDMPEAYFITQNLDPEFVRYFTPLAQAGGAVLMGYSLSIIYKYV